MTELQTKLANAESALLRLTKLGHHNSAAGQRNVVARLRREVQAEKKVLRFAAYRKAAMRALKSNGFARLG